MQILGLISDLLLLAATLGMAVWCQVLTKRLKAFDSLDTGLGDTIESLSLQVDDLKASLAATTERTDDRDARLRAVNTAADDRIGRMEMLLASLEDLEADANSDARFREADRSDEKKSLEQGPTIRFGRGRVQG